MIELFIFNAFLISQYQSILSISLFWFFSSDSRAIRSSRMSSLNPTLPTNFLPLPFFPFLPTFLILYPLLLFFLALSKPTLKLSNLLIRIASTSCIWAHGSNMPRFITSITNNLFFTWSICIGICIWPSWWLLILIFVVLIVCCVWIWSIVVVVVWVWCIWGLVLIAVASGVGWIGVCLGCVLTAES